MVRSTLPMVKKSPDVKHRKNRETIILVQMKSEGDDGVVIESKGN